MWRIHCRYEPDLFSGVRQSKQKTIANKQLSLPVQAANDDPRVHGILVYYPIFGQEETFSGASQDDYLRDSVSYKCDVEGLCHLYRSNLYRNIRYIEPGIKCLVPCTALSVVKILEACEGCFDRTKPVKQQLKQHTITIINRSEIVGRPLAAMLANDGADVYSADIDSIYQFSGNKSSKSESTVEECVRKVRASNCCAVQLIISNAICSLPLS